MPALHIVRENQIVETPRVLQLSGLFDLPTAEKTRKEWHVDLPLQEHPWQIGLIVGSSGSGKSTIARELFGSQIDPVYERPADKAVVDGFPAELGIKEVTELLSSVGFSSPPSWLVPFRCLSNGQQFRASMARLLAEQRSGIAVCDEFTSVVDRTVAQVASAAIARTVRKRQQQFLAVSCHFDILDWLDPDWVFHVDENRFSWRLERRRRPQVQLKIYRADHTAWEIFRDHHYLSGDLNRSAKCFVAEVSLDQGQTFRAAAFAATTPHVGKVAAWRGHRTVVLPDFQGLSIGNTVSEMVASIMTGATGKKYFSLTAHPGMIKHRHRSPLWKCIRSTSHVAGPDRLESGPVRPESRSNSRLISSFQYCGPVMPREQALRLLEERTDLVFPPESIRPALQLLRRLGRSTVGELSEGTGLRQDLIQRWFGQLANCGQLKISRTKPPFYAIGPRIIPGL